MTQYDCKEATSRTEALVGAQAVERMRRAHVAIFGIGGVGGYCAEALIRCGIGKLTLVDADCVRQSNLNRQIIATLSTLGIPKTEAMRARAMEIDPRIEIETRREFFCSDNADTYDFGSYDYIADAIDSVEAKLCLIERAIAAQTPIISAMGAGNKLDPCAFRVTDLSKTQGCPLARVMRRELKKRGIMHLKVVASSELPVRTDLREDGKTVPASISFVPSVAGLIMAGEIARSIMGADDESASVK